MHITHAITILALAIYEVAAGPLPNGATIKRAPPGQCGDHQYTTQQAQDAFDESLGHLQFPATTVIGANGASYPRYFGNRDGNGNTMVVFGGQCNTVNVIDLQEYPIFRDGSGFAEGKDLAADRVVIARVSQGTDLVNEQCGIMTHEGAGGQNAFIKCE